VFSLFLCVYLAVLYTLISRLKRYFPKFYLKERGKLIMTNGVIIMSILSRISMNLFLYLFQEEINESYGSGTWLYPVYQILSSFLSSLFPLAAIIASLIYAINHKKRMVHISERTTLVKQNRNRDSMQSLIEYEEGSEFEDDGASMADFSLPNGNEMI
jgi:hypothetical protein